MDKWLKSNHHISPNTSSIPKSTLTEQPSGNMEKTKTNYSSKKKRKYNESYLQYGFTYTCINNEHRPVCLICNESLASESMKPIKLKRHLTTRHASYAEKPLMYFERLLQSVNKQRLSMENYVFTNCKHLRASYEASYIIAKSKKRFTIGEDLVLPAAVRITEIIHGHKYADEFKKNSFIRHNSKQTN